MSKNNNLIKSGVINVKREKFLTSEKLFSKNNNNTYTGTCDKCPDMCGINLLNDQKL